MQLKSEFRNYESLRREHDSQIIQIAMEAGKSFFFLLNFINISFVHFRFTYFTGTMVIFTLR